MYSINRINNYFWRDVLVSHTIFCECLPIIEGEKYLDLPLFFNHKFLAGDIFRDITKDDFVY